MTRCRIRQAVMLALLCAGACAPHARRDVGPHGGLARSARILVDRWGVLHVEARSLPDLYFAWGYATARDRLWQIMRLRQAADGGLWRWLGNATLRADGGAQLFELRAHAERAWAAQRGDSAAAMPLERYAAGINAYLARCRAGRAPWPAELAALGVKPEDWRPADSVLLLLGEGVLLDLDVPELGETQEIAAHGHDAVARRRRFEGGWIYDTIPDSAAARLYGGRVSAPAAARPDAPAWPGPALRGVSEARAALEAWRGPGASDPDQRASNVFAVGARRSASGYPLLANDTHLPLGIPGPVHAIHVTVPGAVNAIGFYVPGIPTIVSGRNDRCAWGVTALSADVVDLYADTLSADGGRVRWNGGWARVRTAGYDLRLRWHGIPLPALGQVRRYTPHGPILVFDRARRVALSARWAGLEDSLAMGPLLGMERSTSAAEVCRHFRSLTTPCLNVVAADRDGGLIYQASGSVPLRAFDPGPGALPDDGAHEWRGIVPHDRLPTWRPPPSGFVVNCNNRPLDPARYGEPLPRYDWAHDRALEIAGRLGALGRVSLADMRSIQNDLYSRGAERLLPRLLACADSLAGRCTPRERAVLDTLRRWNDVARRDRVAPTLYRGWVGALQRRSRLDGLTGLTAAALEGRAPEALEAPRPPGATGAPALERPAEAALKALALALDSLSTLLGPDLSTWTWGRAHRAVFASGLEDRPGAWAPRPVPVDGDNSTPCVGPSRLPWSTAVTFGPVFRHLVDLAVTDSSLAVLPPGNSGTARSWHRIDQLQAWADHAYVPFYLSWTFAERAKEDEITLEPAP